jgi:ribosome-binding protein aMBF1 (putative translation factor)
MDHVEIPVKNRLRVLRAEKNWSQADLATRVNVSRQTINAIETGKPIPACRWHSSWPKSLILRLRQFLNPMNTLLDEIKNLAVLPDQFPSVDLARKPEGCQ